MNHFLVLIIILLIALIDFSTILGQKEGFVSYYLAQPTKCFSCERELPLGKKYLGGPTKCFSCERQLLNMYGGQMADLGQPSKCFSCERQYRTPLNSPLLKENYPSLY